MLGGLRRGGALKRAQSLGGGGSLSQGEDPIVTKESLDRRRLKWSEPRLGAAVERWWSICGTVDGRLPYDAYRRLNCVLYKALVPAIWDNERAIDCALEDWQLDGGTDGGVLSKAQFFASLAELAEAWAPATDASIDPRECALRDAEWLERVLTAITKPSTGVLEVLGTAETLMLKEIGEVLCIVEPVQAAPSLAPSNSRMRQRGSSKHRLSTPAEPSDTMTPLQGQGTETLSASSAARVFGTSDGALSASPSASRTASAASNAPHASHPGIFILGSLSPACLHRPRF